MKKISILLTKYTDWISNLVYHLAGVGYTHSSIALSDEPELYYSFNYHGFAIETLEKHRRRGVRHSCCYQLEISDDEYNKLKRSLQHFLEHRENYHYTRLGVLCCALHFPLHWKRHYFCSQFVAEVLESSGAVRLQKDSGCYLPNHLIPILETHPGKIQMIENPV